jgi:Outer membrane protein beta-barrel domain
VRRAPVAVLRTACFVAGVAALASAGTARAVGEDEWQVSARAGSGNANGYPLEPWGFAGGLDVEYGLHEAFAARASVGVVSHPVKAVKNGTPAGTLQARTAMLGATYTFDVIRLVPYMEVGVGLLQWSGPGAPRTTMGAELGLGADYLVTTRWAWGASAQYIFSPTDLFSNAMEFGQSPLAFSLTLRVSRIF